VREDFTLMLTNTRDLDGADSDSARVKESYTLETAFDEILGSLPQINGGVKEPVDDDDDDDDESRKRKAGDEAGEAKDQGVLPASPSPSPKRQRDGLWRESVPTPTSREVLTSHIPSVDGVSNGLQMPHHKP
jgi:hypothetical protein